MYYIATYRRDWNKDEFLESGRRLVKHLFDVMQVDPLSLGGTIIDVGCGIGRLSFALAQFFDEVIAVDVSAGMIEQALELQRRLNQANVQFLVSNGLDLGLVQSGICDFALTYTVLQHLPSERLVLNYVGEMARVTRPGGRLLLQLPLYRQRRLIYPLRYLWPVARSMLGHLERWTEITVGPGIAFHGSRLLKKEFIAALGQAGLAPITLQHLPSPYRLCDNVVAYCQKRLTENNSSLEVEGAY